MENDGTALPDADQVRRIHDLTGRVALITGAASGLGKAMAWGLACHGADVVIVDRDGDKAAACAVAIRTIRPGTTGRRWNTPLSTTSFPIFR